MNISYDGLKFIASFEGCRLTAYKPVPTEKYWTIGYGHYGSDVKEGQHITQAEAEAMFRNDLAKYAEAVEKAVTVNVNQHQFDALVSFAYNCGVGALQKSTLLKKVNVGDFLGASKEFAKWNKGGGKVLAGLTRRREAERVLFLSEANVSKKDGWVKDSGKWFFYKNGKKALNEWAKDKNEWYYVGKDGVMVTNQWLEYKHKWYWLESDGKMAHDKALIINDKVYCFDANGIMLAHTEIKLQILPNGEVKLNF